MKDEILNIVSKFTLYDPDDRLLYLEKENIAIISYSKHGFTEAKRRLGPHFDMNYVPKKETAYLLNIYLPVEMRGQGYGQELYTISENIAKKLGAVYLEQTPSGFIKCTNESRRDYLLRRGYVSCGAFVRKCL